MVSTVQKYFANNFCIQNAVKQQFFPNIFSAHYCWISSSVEYILFLEEV